MCKPVLPGYVIVKEVGSGASAVVYKAQKKDSCDVVAVKCFSRENVSTKTVDIICSEIKILKALHHHHIVNMHDFHWDNNFVYIVMDYCQGGDLRSYLKSKKKLSEARCSHFCHQILSALEYLRSLNVVHMDLKPQNILLTADNPPEIKVADFGLSDILNSNDTRSGIRGSPLYMAPEILKHHKYDARADVWSLGVILYECLFGYTPFRGATLEEVVKKIISDSPVQIPGPNYLSTSCADLLSRLLEKDPDKRISFENVLNHPFITQPSASRELSKYDEEKNIAKSVMKTCGKNEKCFNITTSSIADQKPRTRLNELRALSASTPEMQTALEIGVAAVTYDAEGRFSEAFDRYESAISILLKLLKLEPKGHRQKLIQQQVKLWITRAEELKMKMQA